MIKIKALEGKVLVDEIARGERMVGSIILMDDNGKSSGVRPRWCRVHSVGTDITTVSPGEWILVEHGNWTRGIDVSDQVGEKLIVWSVNWPDGVLAASSEPGYETFSSSSTYDSVPTLER